MTLKIGIILGSTRVGRVSPDVGNWIKSLADKRGDATYEIVDIAQFDLPFFCLTLMQDERVVRWKETIAKYDGYIFITQEYNHSITAALKNALDFGLPAWNNKAAGIVSYGSLGGARAAEHLRGILGELEVADVRTHPALSMFSDWHERTTFKPADLHIPVVEKMLDEVISWSTALKSVRVK